MAKRKTKYPGIVRLNSTGRFEIRFRVVDPRTGNLKEVRRTRDNITLREAVAFQEQWREELLEKASARQRERMTVTGYAESWMRSKAVHLRVGPAYRYAQALDNFILPELGDLYLDVLTPMDIREWLTKMTQKINPRSKEPYSPESINGHFRVLRAMLRDAAADFSLPDPTRRVQVLDNHEKGKRKERALTAAELGRFLVEMKQTRPRHYPMTVVAFLTGMRFCEYSSLRWEDILEDEGIILIQRSHWRGHVAATKNTEPRVIPMDDHGMIIKALRDHRMWLLKLQKRKGEGSGYVRGFAKGWVFPSRAGGLSCSSMLDKPFAKVAENISLGHRITSHDARRTFNTLARQASVPDRVIQAIVGHHSDAMTERYDRVEVRERRQAIGQVIQFAQLATKVGDRVGGSGFGHDNAPSTVVV